MLLDVEEFMISAFGRVLIVGEELYYTEDWSNGAERNIQIVTYFNSGVSGNEIFFMIHTRSHIATLTSIKRIRNTLFLDKSQAIMKSLLLSKLYTPQINRLTSYIIHMYKFENGKDVKTDTLVFNNHEFNDMMDIAVDKFPDLIV